LYVAICGGGNRVVDNATCFVVVILSEWERCIYMARKRDFASRALLLLVSFSPGTTQQLTCMWRKSAFASVHQRNICPGCDRGASDLWHCAPCSENMAHTGVVESRVHSPSRAQRVRKRQNLPIHPESQQVRNEREPIFKHSNQHSATRVLLRVQHKLRCVPLWCGYIIIHFFPITLKMSFSIITYWHKKFKS